MSNESSDHSRLCLTGTPRLDGSSEIFPAKAFILLSALLLSPDRALSRLSAASLLWGDVEQKRALGNLRQLLLRLHGISAEGDYIRSQAGHLVPGPKTLRSDLALFLDAVETDSPDLRLKGMLSLRGELLEGHETGQEQFYIWLLSERNRLKTLFFAALGPVLNDLTRFGQNRTTEIITLSNRALSFDEDREQTYREIMGAYARIGDLNSSRQTFERLKALLKGSGRTPETATLALFRRLTSYDIAEDVDSGPKGERQQLQQPRIAFMLPVRFDKMPADLIIQSLIEDVASGLTRYRTFKVLSPHSTYASNAQKGDDFSTKLRPDYIVNTTVFPDQRVSIGLVKVSSDEVIWSLDLGVEIEQLHTAFRIISRQVSSALAERLERHQMELTKTSPPAYLHLLTGQHSLRGHCDLPTLRRARAEFRKAIEIEPTMAVARARLAQTLQLEWLILGGDDPHLLQRADAEASMAMRIDPALGVGHWVSAMVALYRRDFDTSAERFLEAEALSPNSADLLLQHADALAHFGKPDAAWDRFSQAIDLNPFAPDLYWWAGASIAYKRDEYQTAVDLCAHMKNDEPALRVLTVSHALMGNIETASDYAVRLREVHPGMTAHQLSLVSPDRDPEVTRKLFHAYRLAGID
jgi:DNA-binding SARP family transcriptional activator